MPPKPLGTFVTKLPSFHIITVFPQILKGKDFLRLLINKEKNPSLPEYPRVGLLWEVEWLSEWDGAVAWVRFCVKNKTTTTLVFYLPAVSLDWAGSELF